jgi:glycosyltransferase involved in cell wall biosynthesis
MNTTSQQAVIAQIIPELGPGGAEQGCIDIAGEIVKSGSKAIVISNGGPRVHELARVGAMHIDLPVHSKNPITMWRNIARLKKLIKEHNIDILHVRSRAPAWSAMMACKNSAARYMTTCHAPYNFKSKYKQIYNSAITKGERVIAISNYVADYLLRNYKVDHRNIRLIHRGIPLEKFHPTMVKPGHLIQINQTWRLPDGCLVVMMPGRLTRWKGHDVLIEAMAKINRSDVICVLIGSDQGRAEYRKELEDKIDALNLEGRIRIIDHCDDMPAAYMLSTVVVSASTDPEGFGRIPVEAQAMGRPVIATDHGGAQETILRGQTGWLVPPNDAQALAHAIEEALSLTNVQRSNLATRAMMHVAEHFSKEQMADATLNVYAELIQEKYNIPSYQSDEKQAAE